MRIDRIQVGAFGRLQDFDTGPDSLPGLVVVLGPNEAGKSTLFTYLTTALYGFQPATRERNPHVPWGADEASGLIRVRLDSGGCAEVERRLRSQPSGRVTVDGRVSDLRNQPAPWVGHVPRTVFRQVFAITLGELAGLDGETWARIQDKVIGSMGAADLLSARVVAENLEREAGEIWRSNRRGNQTLRDLQASLRELRGRRSAAQERDARIRRLVEEREGVRAELRSVRERRQLDRAEVDRAQALVPVKRQLDRVAALREEAGSPDELRGLPSDPFARFQELQAERERLVRVRTTVDEDIADREATIERVHASAPLIERREQIVRLVAKVSGTGPDRVRIVELEAEIGDIEARLDAAAPSLLTGPWRDVSPELLASAPVELLRDRVNRTPHTEESVAGSALEGAAVLGALLVGLALLGWGLAAERPLGTALGAAALATAATSWWMRARTRGPGDVSISPGGGDDVTRLLRGIPVRPELLTRADESLVSGLERLRDYSRQAAELAQALCAARERVEEVEASAAELAGSLRRDASTDVELLARDLDRELRESEAQLVAARTAERELERLMRQRTDAMAQVATVGEALDALVARVQALSPGEPLEALQHAGARLTASRTADQLEDELVRGYPDLDVLRSQIDELDQGPEPWSVGDESLARAKARIEHHEEGIEDLLRRGEALEGEVNRLRELDTVDAVDSEIASLRAEESRLMRVRDRKWVLARLLREADRRFREEHQPDLLRRAGSYLQHLTGGRYERLVIDEADGDHLFHLVGPGLPAPVPLAPPVSTGTLEQAYLSLRLAIVDHLDQGGERLPLFVDEVFVNWDGQRRSRGLELLSNIAGARQVFVFTCHPDVAAGLEARGGRVLELGGC